MKKNFRPARTKTGIQKTTYMNHNFDGICAFEIHGANYAKDYDTFSKAYKESRIQLFKDMGREEWSEEKDIGYQNFLRVSRSGDFELGYYENKFYYRESAQILCCEEWLSLGKFTNTCPHCKTDYNGSGQVLAPRKFWGEETGEHWTECY